MIPIINSDQEIVTIRVLEFSKGKVYKAWSNPEQLKDWWGPKGFWNTFELFDFRPGGQWKFVMHEPERGNYKNECEFLKIEEPNLIYWKRLTQPLFQVCATFEEIEKGSTKITFRMIFDSVEACNKIKPFAIDKNEENFDKLNILLERLYT
ncbi:SRPBCC domain-containing protein [Rufibacter hautae]|uniref:ATPase n=1 Tax=Rufibacter hautae TaxID=2595005 RepID=A0A5B6TK56_9BACT|nr:SRPBCC domain-containing protein [Rufibacter hautae]KAA3439755.1 ATPase [Rufibacter hautae]